MKLALFIARCGALQIALAAAPLGMTSQAQAQSVVPVQPYNLGDAVRDAEAARRPPLQAPAAEPVLPQISEPQLTIADHETLFVRAIEIEGPELGGETEAREILAAYEN